MASMSAATVTSNGQILFADAPIPQEHVMETGSGSYITAAGNKVTTAMNMQNKAMNMLGGKQMGGATQVVVHPPTMVTAGNATTHPNDLYANLYAVRATGQANAMYDGLTNAAPQMAGKRTRRKNKRHARTKSKGHRHGRRRTRKRSHVSRSHRRIRKQ